MRRFPINHPESQLYLYVPGTPITITTFTMCLSPPSFDYDREKGIFNQSLPGSKKGLSVT